MSLFNFSAGPAVLPAAVLERAAAELGDWHGSGMSVMEMSHRGKEFTAILARIEADFRRLLAVPDNYRVLFMQGGASAQFALVPLNLLGGKTRADFVNTGEWSGKAIKEIGRYGEAHVAASSADRNFSYVPDPAGWDLDPEAAYVHICTNETIGGVEYFFTPDTGTVPLVADMSSHLLSRPIDVGRYGVIYAGAQKNIGPAGLTLVIVRDDLLDRASPLTPSVFRWRELADQHSMINTPPTWAMYIAGLVFEWLLAEGGLTAIEAVNRAKAALLYDCIDRSSLYRNGIDPAARSRMNVPFTLRDPDLDAAFLQGAEREGLMQLKGHRLAGGMRASIYNAMPLAGVQALVDYMREFERSLA